MSEPTRSNRSKVWPPLWLLFTAAVVAGGIVQVTLALATDMRGILTIAFGIMAASVVNIAGGAWYNHLTAKFNRESRYWLNLAAQRRRNGGAS